MRLARLVGVILAPLTAHAASYDCKAVLPSPTATTDEKTVCLDEHLSALDDLVAKAYANVRVKIGDDARWRAKEFLTIRRNCEAVKSCIATAYIDALQTYETLGSGLSLPPWVDRYVVEVGALPLQVGTCTQTTINEVAGRLQGDNDFSTGTSVLFENGTAQVSYDREGATILSRPGDKVLECLISVPRNCPPGDLRGKVYTVTNFRTERSWTLPDSQHGCGGA